MKFNKSIQRMKVMIRACIFDLDGTLANTLESIACAGNRALEAVGLQPLPMNNYKYYAGDGAKTLVERMLKDSGDQQLLKLDEAFEIYSDFFRADCTYKVTVFDGIYEVIQKLKAKGIKVTVLSNKPHERTLDVIHKLFGDDVFDVVWGQKDSLPKKPDPTGALMTAKTLGVEPKECLYIGDTDVDMQTGNGAGMVTVGVLWGFRDMEELKTHGAHYIIEHPDEIYELAKR